MTRREQACLPGMERATVAPSPAAYTVVVCRCRTRVVVGAGVTAVACPSCRQMVAGALVGFHEPFCACGRRWSDCDGSRARCHKNGGAL